MRYGAFISYSHSDAELAGALQRGVERFGKRWNQARAVKLFRDNVSMSASPGLWSSIEAALAQSSWLVLLASPKAAQSQWVDKEVRWWLEHRSAQTVLIVLTSGEIEWDESRGDYDWDTSTALPPALAGASHEVPRYVDARWSRSTEALSEVNPKLKDAIVDIASAVRGIEKDELVGEAVREQRRTKRLARGAQTGLATLFVAAVVAAVVAVAQKDKAEQQATISLSRQLAATSENELGKNLDVALLLAFQGWHTQANEQTRAALLAANTASPKLVRYVPMGAVVTKVGASRDGTIGLAGLADGRVMRWVVADPRPERILKLPGAVSSVTVSRDGAVVAASDGTRATLWRRGRPSVALQAPAGQRPDVVAVSPAGRTVLVHGTAGADGGESSVSIVDVPSARTSVHERQLGFGPFLIAYSDDEALISSGGSWERREIPGWRTRARGSIPLGVHRSAGEPSADGRFLAATNGATPIPVWPAVAGDAEDPAPLDAQAPIRSEGLIALSPDGGELAAVEGGVIYVAPVRAAGAPRGGHATLAGNAGIRDVRFLEDGSHLLSASRSSVGMWDLGQLDRLARVTRSPLPPACNACEPPTIAASADGRLLAMVGGAAAGTAPSALVQPLGEAASKATIVDVGSGYGPPVWVAGGQRVVFGLTNPGESGAGAPAGVRLWPAGGKGVPVQAAALGPDDGTVIVVDTHANIYVQDAVSGRVRETIAGPGRLQGHGETLQSAAIQSSAGLVVTLGAGALRITDVGEREVVRHKVPATGALHVAFAGRRLLVEREDGSLEVWDMRGTHRERVLPGGGGFVLAPVGNAQGTRVARQREGGAIELSDLDSGALLGRFEAPPIGGPPESGMTFSPDGSDLISVSEYPESGVLVVRRDISDEELVKSACAAAGRDLTPAEWREFVGSDPPDDLTCG